MSEATARRADWIPVVEALERIVSALEPVGTEVVPLPALAGRILAERVTSPIDHPPWDNSAMDGYAVRAIDIQGAGADFPITLRIVDDIPAGSFPTLPIGPGEAARIMTGAPVPVGSDSVVRVEHTRPGTPATGPEAGESSGVVGGTVEVLEYSDSWRNIRLRGEDLKVGGVVLEPGQVLRAGEVGLLALVGRGEAVVRRRPRVAILATGDELVPPDRFEEVEAGRRIVDSNSPMLAAALVAAGCEPVPLGIAADRTDSLREHLARAMAADALITTAGASVGEFDLVKDALDTMGYEPDFWRVKMRPGSPFPFGRLGGLPVFGVAGNPASVLVTFEVLIRPALRRLLGRTAVHSPTLRVTAAERIHGARGLPHFSRGRLAPTGDGGWQASLTGPQGSGILSSMGAADALLVVPAGVPAIEPGEAATAIPLLTGDPAREAAGFED
jgi:molybdopterin molybdotransferase